MAGSWRTSAFSIPRTEPETVQIDVDRARYWLSVGAQPSAAVERLLKSAGPTKPPLRRGGLKA